MSRLREIDAERRRGADHGPDFSEALARGLTVIKAFDAERRQMTLSDVARQVDLPRATTRRALHTLSRLGFIESDGRLFRLTPQVLTLAAAYLGSNPVSTLVQPVCERIAAEVDGSCTAAVLDGIDVVMIARASSALHQSVGLGLGYRLPAFCSALGRVLLAALPDPALDRWLAALKPVRVTPLTVIDKRRLARAIRQVREDGHALVDQEAEPGFRSIAVPLRRHDGQVVAAMNVGVHLERAGPETMRREFLPVLRRHAEGLRAQLI